MTPTTIITNIELWANVIFVTYKNAPARFVSYRQVPSYLILPLADVLNNKFVHHSFKELEIALATQECVRRFNGYKQIWLLCRRMGWSWSIDNSGYVIEGVYCSTYFDGIAQHIANELFNRSLVA